jgi:hypothetical protein
MNTNNPNQNPHPDIRSRAATSWCKATAFMLGFLLAVSAQAQTTIKPFQVRVESDARGDQWRLRN